MKKLFLLLALFPLFCFGQNETKDMEFMKIPIEGTVAEFRDALIEKHGFTNQGIDSNAVVVKGNFWRFDDIEVRLIGQPHEEIHTVSIKLSQYVYKDKVVQLLNKLNELYGEFKYEEDNVVNTFTWLLDNGLILIQEWKIFDRDDFYIVYKDKTELEKMKAEIREEDSDL